MTLATLHGITQNRNTALTSWSGGSMTLGTVFFGAYHRVVEVQNTKTVQKLS